MVVPGAYGFVCSLDLLAGLRVVQAAECRLDCVHCGNACRAPIDAHPIRGPNKGEREIAHDIEVWVVDTPPPVSHQVDCRLIGLLTLGSSRLPVSPALAPGLHVGAASTCMARNKGCQHTNCPRDRGSRDDCDVSHAPRSYAG